VTDEFAAANVIAEEGFQNIREVKSFVREDYQVDRYTAAQKRTLRVALKLVRIRSTISPAVNFLFLANIALIIWFGGHEVVAGRLSRGELVAFLVYGDREMASELGWVYRSFKRRWARRSACFRFPTPRRCGMGAVN
jgi:ABC-type multidrug transport system fused ATPase/permease subunit